MRVPVRPLLAPGIAVATAGAIALGPSMVVQERPAVPAVHIADIQLAGIGQDIYYAVTPYVQYAVGGVSYLINFIPLLGAPTAAQININYFQGIQPIVESTVNYLAAVVQDPFNFPTATSVFAGQLYGIGYNWVSAELMWLGLAPLPPLAPAAASVTAPVQSPGVNSGDRAMTASLARVGGEDIIRPDAVEVSLVLKGRRALVADHGDKPVLRNSRKVAGSVVNAAQDVTRPAPSTGLGQRADSGRARTSGRPVSAGS